MYADNLALKLGRSFDPDLPFSTKTRNCVVFDGTPTLTTSNPKVEMQVKEVTDLRELYQRLGISIKASARYMGLSGRARQSIDEEVLFNARSVTWVAYVKADYPAEWLDEQQNKTRLTEHAEAMLRADEPDHQAFKSICGTRYVLATGRGVTLAAIFSLRNVSEERRLKVSSEIELSAGEFGEAKAKNTFKSRRGRTMSNSVCSCGRPREQIRRLSHRS